jgi:hypothetical protein
MKTWRDRCEFFGVLAFAITVSGCIYTPSGGSQQSTTPVTFHGATRGYFEHVDLFLLDRRGAEVGATPDLIPIAEVSTARDPSPSGLYQLSVTLPPSALPPWAWIPQVDAARKGPVSQSVGRLEIVARPRGLGEFLDTFSLAALSCLGTAAGRANPSSCSDGDSFVVYDNDGVGVDGPPPAAADFVRIGAPIALEGLARGIVLEVGSYQVPRVRSSKVKSPTVKVNAVVCRPARVPPSGLRTVILNHGGFAALDSAALDACVYWARAGWLAALSAYRFEPIDAPTGPRLPYTYPERVGQEAAPGQLELCLGEVTDVLRWLDIVRARPDTDDSQILMWGYSHGACITLRSLEQGAKVTAAVAVSAPTDFFTWNPDAARGILPPEEIPAAYQARSAVRMAGDLKRRSDVRLLLVAVEKDIIVHPSQSCLLAKTIGAENHLMLPLMFPFLGGNYSNWTALPPGRDFAGCGDPLTWTGTPVNWNTRAVFLLYANDVDNAGHVYFGYTTPPPCGTSWPDGYDKGIRDFLQAAFPVGRRDDGCDVR